MKPLTDKQKRFVQEYLIDLNATQAAIRAGYSEKTANRTGPRMLSNVGIQTAIQTAMDQRAERTQIRADRVVRELACIAFANVADYMTWGTDGVVMKACDDVPPDKTAAIAEVSKTAGKAGYSQKLKLHNKVAALDKLARHLGLYQERTPLDILLGGLPPDLANAVRRELATLSNDEDPSKEQTGRKARQTRK